MVKRGLGRGLSSLIPSLGADSAALEEIPVEEIRANPSQPRQRHDAGAFSELVASVGRHGIVQPVVVRPLEVGYELVAGERRWRAAKEAGLAVVPAIVKQAGDGEAFQLALIENIQRENLNAVEEALAYKRLTGELNCTQAELAELVGKKRTTVANTMRLLHLADVVLEMISDGRLSAGHARALLTLSTKEEQEKLAQKVVSERLSVRQTEEAARLRQMAKDKRHVKKVALPPEVKAMAKSLGLSLGAKVRAKLFGDKIKVEIELKSADDLRRLEEMISGSR